MAARPCPKCKHLLEIPKPPPAKIHCPGCGAVIRLAAVTPATKSNPDLALSLHDLAGKSLTAASPPAALPETVPFLSSAPPAAPSENNLFEIDQGEDSPSPIHTRKKGGGGLILITMALALLVVLGVLLFFKMGNKKDPEKSPAAALDLAELDKQSLSMAQDPRISEAGARGVEYLKKQLQDGTPLYHRAEMTKGDAHLGAAALAGLTLLEYNLDGADPLFEQVAASLRAKAPDLYSTYTLAIAILFLDRWHQARPLSREDRQWIHTFALRLAAAQDSKTGFWGYGTEVKREDEDKALEQLKSGHAAGRELEYRNLSNSQFAALALWAAKRHGVPVGPALQAVAKAARAGQLKEGTWNYDKTLTMNHSGVCAGLIFLALERGLEESTASSGGRLSKDNTVKIGKNFLEDPAVAKGMNFLTKLVNRPPTLSAERRASRQQSALTVKDYHEKSESGAEKLPTVSWTPEFAFSGTIFGADSWGDLYLLWSIERVAVIYDLKRFGGKDWYAWGADIILQNQKANGSWEDRFPGVPDTCFALLFLKRANIAKDLTDKLREALNMNAVMDSTGNQPRAVPPRKH